MSVKEKPRDYVAEGKAGYEAFRKGLVATPELRAIYEEESRKKELWFQLVEARQQAKLTQAEMAKRIGVSQAQVARIEKSGYDSYTLNTLRRYIAALGGQFELEVRVKPKSPKAFPAVAYAP
jgi:DNA-binding XRE family transcriptional regulator